MPAHARRLIKASVFPSVFKLYVVLVCGVLLYLSMSSGFNLPNQYDSIKIFNDGQKKRRTKNPQETESEDEPPRVSPSEQEWLKHILVAVDVVPVLIRYVPKQRCFKGWFFMTQWGICVSPWCMPFSICDG